MKRAIAVLLVFLSLGLGIVANAYSGWDCVLDIDSDSSLDQDDRAACYITWVMYRGKINEYVQAGFTDPNGIVQSGCTKLIVYRNVTAQMTDTVGSAMTVIMTAILT